MLPNRNGRLAFRRYPRVMRLTIALCLLLLPFRSVAQDLRAQEKITVERILVDARVTEMGGEPILNLTAKDFRVKIDGIAATVESVDWIPETAAERDIADVDKAEAPDSVDVPQA